MCILPSFSLEKNQFFPYYTFVTYPVYMNIFIYVPRYSINFSVNKFSSNLSIYAYEKNCTLNRHTVEFIAIKVTRPVCLLTILVLCYFKTYVAPCDEL